MHNVIIGISGNLDDDNGFVKFKAELYVFFLQIKTIGHMYLCICVNNVCIEIVGINVL